MGFGFGLGFGLGLGLATPNPNSLIQGIEFKDSKPILISDLLAAEMKKARPVACCTPLALHP